MPAEVLKKSFDLYFEAPLEAWEHFVSKCSSINFKKDEIIKRQGDYEKYFYFIIKGSVGLFLWRENSSVCLDFAFDRNFCCDYMSLLTKSETPLELVALENCEMLKLQRDEFYNLGKTPMGQVILQVSAETSFVEKQQQQIELLTKTAEERYMALINKFPNIHHRVAQKHIASYLGITPQSLSRILNA